MHNKNDTGGGQLSEELKRKVVGSSVWLGAALEWHKGPAEEGQGTAGKDEETGAPLFYDGERLMIIVETSDGREIAVVDIAADEDYFRVTDVSTGDIYDAWGPECWSWWAKLTSANLPPNNSGEPCGQRAAAVGTPPINP